MHACMHKKGISTLVEEEHKKKPRGGAPFSLSLVRRFRSIKMMIIICRLTSPAAPART